MLSADGTLSVSRSLLIIQRYEHAGVHKWMWELGQYQTPTYCELVQTAQQGSVGQQMKEVKTARIRGQNSGTYVCEMRKNKLLRSQFAGMQKLPHLYSYEIWGQQILLLMEEGRDLLVPSPVLFLPTWFRDLQGQL